MRKVKFTLEQKELVVEMYSVNEYPMTKIINECGFPITKETVYRFLKESGIPLERKNGNKRDIVGKTFGYLTVLRMAKTEKSGKAHAWRAICSCSNCGNENFDVNPQNLLRNATTSCGCSKDRYIKITGINNKQYTGCGELNGKYWGTIKKRAEHRGHNVCVSVEYAWNLYLEQERKCKLSGLPIEFAISNKKSSETTASLDRIDSNLGYVEGNVQWVHKHVNIMKNIYSQNHFIEMCKLIANNNK